MIKNMFGEVISQTQIDAYNKKKVRKIVTGSKRKSNPVSVKKNIKRRVK